ncbi:ATP-binding protein [Candidatus Dependentiae bacterium]|nr:ATP-binding protein [Candidatus Dependentiae bacterium]
MIVREIAKVVLRYAQIFQVVSIQGPRQSGKTTLARQLFPQLPYVSLENIDIRREALSDPRSFLERYKSGAIFDEVQNAPDLLSYLQQIVDEDQAPGRFVVTGSQNLALSQTGSQSLAGRVGVVTLLPLSLKEINSTQEWQELVLRGGYPRVTMLNLAPHEFFPSYVQTYVERDVRNILNVGNLVAFQNFVQLCAGHVGQVINYTSLAQDAGISVSAAREWLSVLEASYVIFRLPTYFKNLNKRRIKMPKLYFYDTGLAAYLLGLQTVDILNNYYRKGALFENLIILELMKSKLNKGLSAQLSFWRDYSGVEVDLIIEDRTALAAVEIKSGKTLHPDDLKNVEKFVEMEPSATMNVVYSGDAHYFGKVQCVNWKNIEKLIPS